MKPELVWHLMEFHDIYSPV